MTKFIIRSLATFRTSNILTTEFASSPIDAKTPPKTKQNNIKPNTFKLLLLPGVASKKSGSLYANPSVVSLFKNNLIFLIFYYLL